MPIAQSVESYTPTNTQNTQPAYQQPARQPAYEQQPAYEYAPQPAYYEPAVERSRGFRPWVVIVLGALVLALGGVVAYLLINRGGEKEATTEEVANAQTSTVESQEFTSPTLGTYVYTGPVVTDATGQLVPNGHGRAEFRKGDFAGATYEGPFVLGAMDGVDAVYFFDNGDRFEGTFHNNLFDYGTIRLKSTGQTFTGPFKDGEPDAERGTWK